MKLLLKNSHIVDPMTGRDEVADILIVEGMIHKISSRIGAGREVLIHDCSGKIVAPGFFDMHVHLREPGFEYKETIETGCRAAANGGFTGIACMPNTDPPIDDASVVRWIRERASQAIGGVVDVQVIAAVSKGRLGKELAPLLELAEAGAVAFTDDGAPVADAELMRRALEYGNMTGKPIIQHAEEVSMTKGGAMNEGFVSTSLGMPAMPPVAEEVMIARDLHLVRFTKARYHVAHISTSGGVDLVRSAKKDGLLVTCEVTPHHFTLIDEMVRTFDTNTKMNPPLRTKDDIEATKEGLRDGTIDVIATDHAPHSFDEKQVEYTLAPFGIVGLETAVGLAFTELVHAGVLPLVSLIEKLSINPRTILGLPAVRVVEGERANLTILDPDIEWIVDSRKFKSRSKNSPFNRRTLRGRAIAIFNNGIFLPRNSA